MAWTALDRITPSKAEPITLRKAVVEKIKWLLPRYAVKRAALLPALHIVQDTYGHIPPSTVPQIAEALDLHPSDILDAMSFYTHFWDHPKGKEVITLCRSLSCALMGAGRLAEAVEKHLRCKNHGTSEDGRYSILHEECLALCEKAPCLIVGERAYGPVKPEDVPTLLDNPDAAKIPYRRVTDFCAPTPEEILRWEGPDAPGAAQKI